MSLLWFDGFETFGTSTGTPPQPTGALGRKYTVEGESSIDLETGRLGGYCVDLSSSTSIQTFAINTNATIIMGFAFKATDTLDNGSYWFAGFMDGEYKGINLVSTAAGEISVRRSTTVIGTTTGLGLVAGNWYWIELKVTVNNTTGSYELRVGGANVLSDSGIDTQSQSNAYYDTAAFSGSPYSNYYYDDFYVCNAAGSVNNDFLGNVKVTALYPSAAGNSTQWTPSAGANYECVDENPVNDDTDYVESSTSTHKDLYDYDALGSTTGIKGIQVNTDCRETDATSYSLYTTIRSGTTDYDDSAQAIGTTNYVTKVRVAELDPDTSVAWTYTGINSAEFGIKVS